jgi:hypothetical protein
MIKSLIPASAVLLCSAFALAAGGGAGGGVAGAPGVSGGGHPSGAAHRGSPFGNPGIENNTFPGVRAPSPCIGAVAGVPTSGAPWPIAPATANPSPTNGSAIGGTVQSNPDLPRLTQQDERILAAIKQANEKLGEVGNPPNGRTDRQPSRGADVMRTNDGIQRRDSGRSRPLAPLALGDSSRPALDSEQTGCQPHE